MPLDPFEITGSLAIGTGLGGAIKDTVDPRLQKFKNDQWSQHQNVPLTAGTAAEIAAEDVAKYDAMAKEATLTGFEGARFKELYGVTLNAPGMGELLQMLRRSDEVNIDFDHGLRKAKLETRWDDALRNLRHVRIPGPDLAYMVVRGVVPDGGTLPSSLPTTADNLQLPPQLKLDTILEASRTGWDAERFAGLVARSGLAMAPGLAAQARFRKILTQNDYELTIARGDLFPAYADPMLEVSRQIPTADQFVEAWLRGWITQQEAENGAALHGMRPAYTDLIHKVKGRPVTFHEITTGLARGGTYPSTYDDIPEPYRKSIQEADIRPEWASLHYHNRYTYPSAFVLRSLAQAGDLGGQAAVAKVLEEIGWKPSFAQQVSTAWTTAGTTGDSHTGKAQNQLWTATHKSYIAQEIGDATATTALSAAGVAAAAVPAILALWKEERSLIRKQLSPTQIRKALNLGVVNPATGVPWTIADAHAALLERGYDDADATVFLQE